MRVKTRYVVAVAVLATVVPLLPGMAELAYLTNPAFYAAALLVAYYLLVGLVTWLLVKLRRPSPLPLRALIAYAQSVVMCPCVFHSLFSVRGRLGQSEDHPLAL